MTDEEFEKKVLEVIKSRLKVRVDITGARVEVQILVKDPDYKAGYGDSPYILVDSDYERVRLDKEDIY